MLNSVNIRQSEIYVQSIAYLLFFGVKGVDIVVLEMTAAAVIRREKLNPYVASCSGYYLGLFIGLACLRAESLNSKVIGSKLRNGYLTLEPIVVGYEFRTAESAAGIIIYSFTAVGI